MPPDRDIPGSPADWLARARGDLALASLQLPHGGFYEDLCFHAQQAAEKAIKAVYRANGLNFRYTHDIGELLDALERRGFAVPEPIQEAIELTSFAWEARYPGATEPVTEDEHLVAVEMAERVVRWAATIVAGGSP